MSAKRNNVAPRWLTPTSEHDKKRGDGPLVADFIEATCRQVKDTVSGHSGDPILLRPWQRDYIIDPLFARRADGRYCHRTALVGLARKNGKSALGSGFALYGLVMGADGAEVYSCAGDRDQARIVFGVAKRMVEVDPELSSICKLYRDAIEVPSTGAIYRVLSSDAPRKEGLSPTLVLFDELHVQPDDELWNVMNLGLGARRDPMVVAITTAGVRSDRNGNDSVCFRLYQHGQKVATGEVADPTFFMSWWEPSDPTADHRVRDVWDAANPGLGDLIDPEDMESACRRTPEVEFRTKRCNLFVATADSWFPAGEFESRQDPTVEVPDGTEITIGFDGSYSGDSTGLVGCTMGAVPHLFVIDAWEKPPDNDQWRVPIADVEESIRRACARWEVRTVACDPHRWSRSMQALESEGWPITEWPTNSAPRIVPACASFYDAVMDERLTHDGDPRLVRHVRNAVIKRDAAGVRITKENKMSPRKIDLAVCAVIAHAEAILMRAPTPTFFGGWS